MVDEYKIDTNKLEWAVFLFNIMGEDKSYFRDLYKVQVAESVKSGEALIHFLNSWGMRRSNKEIIPKIDGWYTEDVIEKLKSLTEKNLIKVNLNDKEVDKAIIIELYNGLCNIKGISNTGASKILHMLNPGLFVMWDNSIIKHYFVSSKEEIKSKEYISFLEKMQEIANYLKNHNIDCKYLSSKIKDPMEKNLENLLSDEKEKDKIIKFAEKDGKTIAKFIDEYNWIVYTKRIPLPPTWYP